MGRYANTKPIVDTALSAMVKIGNDYATKWTGGWFYPWKGPEYLYVTAAAKAIADKFPVEVYCEYNTRDAVDESRLAKKRGRPFATMSAGARPDILVADGNGKFRLCIEIKRSAYSVAHLRNDIERCANLIRSTDDGYIDAAAILFLTHTNANPKSQADAQAMLDHRIIQTFAGGKSRRKGAGEGDRLNGARKILESRPGVTVKPIVGPLKRFDYEDDDGTTDRYYWVGGGLKIEAS